MTDRQVDVIYTDIQKCFDRLSHDAIIDKLVTSGFSKPLVYLFADYLQERNIYVKYEKFYKSKPFQPPSGIAQGSKLSSLLFILTYNDINKHIIHSQFRLYADDLKIFKIINSIEDCQLLQNDIDSIQKWLASIGLNFHPEKCSKITFTNKKTFINHTYHINQISIKPVTNYKDLGITIQSDLTWNLHIEETINKAYKKLGTIIRHCGPIEDIDAIVMLYKSLVKSTIEYGSEIWIPKTKVKFKEIERVQAKFVRYLFHKFNGFYPQYPNYIEYNLLRENLNIESLEDSSKAKQIKLLQKILHNQINSSYLLEKLAIKIPKNNLRIHAKNVFFALPHPRETQYYKSPLISAMHYYNQLEIKPDLCNMEYAIPNCSLF
ncbi:hypothetical protein WDU94_005662 [Cyamophila willieti]